MSTTGSGRTTHPPIPVAQNTDRALRLLAAQRRLYSDAKVIHGTRLVAVGGGAALAVAAALVLPQGRSTLGLLTGSALLLLGVLGGAREKRRSREAAAVQEEFDTHVFGLPWNDMLVEHPSPTLIAEAARRYRGPSVRDWYPDTAEVVRPLDVLICQRSNLGWGSSMHRSWAAILCGVLVALVVLAMALGSLVGLPFGQTLAVIIAPLLAPLREIAEMIRANWENAQTKSRVEGKILDLWRRGLADPAAVTEADCCRVQDRISFLRQSNASVPDWLNRVRHAAQEATMRLSADHMIEEARRHGAVQH